MNSIFMKTLVFQEKKNLFPFGGRPVPLIHGYVLTTSSHDAELQVRMTTKSSACVVSNNVK